MENTYVEIFVIVIFSVINIVMYFLAYLVYFKKVAYILSGFDPKKHDIDRSCFYGGTTLFIVSLVLTGFMVIPFFLIFVYDMDQLKILPRVGIFLVITIPLLNFLLNNKKVNLTDEK